MRGSDCVNTELEVDDDGIVDLPLGEWRAANPLALGCSSPCR